MESRGPEGVERVTIDVGVIHLDGSFRFIVSEEIFEFNDTAGESEGKSFIFNVFNKRGSCVSQETDMEIAVFFSFKIHRVSTVELTVRLAVFIMGGSILVPETIASRSELESLTSFTKTEDKVVVD